MSNPTLLSTNTLNFQDLIGNGRSYAVPPYQRDYSWSEEEWEDLWMDLMELRGDPAARHYMGSVVVKAETDRKFVIIDGQQRIATLTILGLAVIKLLHKRAEEGDQTDDERAQALRNRFVGEKDPASLTEVSKLTLNSHDDGFFQDYLVQLRQPLNPRSLSKSNRLLWDCFQYYERQINGDDVYSLGGLNLAQLLSEVVARRLLFIQITVADEVSAYTVFETLNARGLELTTTDLLKNYLFSRLSAQSDLSAVQRRWGRLVTTVRQERFGEFLRYHYLTRFEKVRTGRLFKMVREEVKSPPDVLRLVSALEDRAELFDALGDATHSLWSDMPGASAYIDMLSLFRVRQPIPLLFTAYEGLVPEEFVKLLKCVVAVSFRYTVISRLNSNELEPQYHKAAASVLGGADSAKKIFDSLRPIYVSDDKFESDFADASVATSGSRRKIAKYILCKLEEDVSNKPCDYTSDPGTIEHILPENPGDEWDDAIPRDQWEAAVYRIGNLTLLKQSKNREIGARPYGAKVQAYRESEYALTRIAVERAPEEWTMQLLNKRQRLLAGRAKHIWRSDFA